jgi:hypothetical protein
LEICVIGVGPRGLAVAERLCANRELRAGQDVVVHLVDPYLGQGGRVWRTTQSRLLLMNTVASQVTMFTDTSVECAGPVRPGPSLYDWARLVTPGRDPDGYPAWLRAEAASLGPDSYPTRACYGHYLAWVLDHILGQESAGFCFLLHPRTAIALEDDENGAQTVVLDDGTRLLNLTAVVLAQGHVAAAATGTERRLARFAAARGLHYRRSGNPADTDFGFVTPGLAIGLRGMGLNFFDHLALLTSGRGGTFDQVGGELRYRPSGAEPVLYTGSRRGIPYHARGHNQKGADGRHQPLFLTPETIGRLREAAPLMFVRDIWPLVRKEVEVVYYRALILDRAGQVAASAFADAFLAAEGDADVPRRFGIGKAELWDWRRMAHPDRGRRFGSPGLFRDWLLEHLRADLRHARQGNVGDPVKAALDTLRDLRNEVRLLVDHGGVTGGSYRDELEAWFTPFNAFASIGPPARRIEEMIALVEAGVLHVIGPGMRVGPAAGGAGFLVSSPAVRGSAIELAALVEARLPPLDIRTTTDPLLRDLRHRGGCRVFRIPDPDGPGHVTGGLAVTRRPYRLVDVTERAHPRRFAFGVPTEGVHWATAAGIRPGVNSVILGDADAIARACLSLPLSWPTAPVRSAGAALS